MLNARRSPKLLLYGKSDRFLTGFAFMVLTIQNRFWS